MLRRLVVPAILCFATIAAAEDDPPPPETQALLAVAQDANSPWRARAAALRVLSKAEEVPAAPLAALARDDERAALRRLALAALVATAGDEPVGKAVTRALSDHAAGVRREALVGVAARAAACGGTRDAVIGLLRDDEPLLRAHAARAIAALGNEAIDVRAAAGALLPLLADEDAGPLAARALVAARPDASQLETHSDALRALVRARGGPVPAAIVLSAAAGRRGLMWEKTLRAYVETGSPAVRQAAWAAIAIIFASRMDHGMAPPGVWEAAAGPDSLIVAAALRLHRGRRLPYSAQHLERLKRHDSKLVRTLVTRLLPKDEDQ